MGRLPKQGDVLLICAINGQCAYGHVVKYPSGMGPLVQVYLAPCDSQPDEIVKGEKLFPVVAVGVNPPVRSGRWKIIGKASVDGVEIPKYLNLTNTVGDPKATWWLFDGEKRTFLGDSVPEEYRELEWKAGWNYEGIERRIKTGKSEPIYETHLRKIREQGL